jgi:hypothetical protein
MFGRDNIDKEWIGKSIILYVDPHVQYAGKEVKGIRVRLIDKKADAVTAYWSKARELGFTRAEGLEHLKTFNNDFTAALKEWARRTDATVEVGEIYYRDGVVLVEERIAPRSDPGDVRTAASAFRVVHDHVTAVFRHEDLPTALAATDLTDEDLRA